MTALLTLVSVKSFRRFSIDSVFSSCMNLVPVIPATLLSMCRLCYLGLASKSNLESESYKSETDLHEEDSREALSSSGRTKASCGESFCIVTKWAFRGLRLRLLIITLLRDAPALEPVYDERLVARPQFREILELPLDFSVRLA